MVMHPFSSILDMRLHQIFQCAELHFRFGKWLREIEREIKNYANILRRKNHSFFFGGGGSFQTLLALIQHDIL